MSEDTRAMLGEIDDLTGEVKQLQADNKQLQARIVELEKEMAARNKQPHKCKGCNKLIYYQSYCKRCKRQLES